jgi:hypothetical protein
MRIADISSSSLREWVIAYTDRTLSEARAKKTSSSAFNDLWRSYNELDWDSLRALQDLRPAARNRFSPDEIDLATQKKMRSLARLWRGKDAYDRPFSLALEAQVLREMLGIPDPPRSVVEVLL